MHSLMNTQSKEQSQKEEQDWKTSFDYPNYTSELWAAKFGHTIACGDLRQYSFPDKSFESWVHQLFEILHSNELIKELRVKLLSEVERKHIAKEIEDGF